MQTERIAAILQSLLWEYTLKVQEDSQDLHSDGAVEALEKVIHAMSQDAKENVSNVPTEAEIMQRQGIVCEGCEE